MIWIKVASAMKFNSDTGGAERAYPLAVDDSGFRVKEPVVALVITDRSSANAKAGARIEHGASADSAWFAIQSTPIAVATFGAPPLTATGSGGTSPALLPYFRTVVLAQGSGAAEWFVADVYVGGKPF